MGVTYGSIIQVVGELLETVGHIDLYYATQANEQQAITNVVIQTIKNELENTEDINQITPETIIEKVLNFKFRPENEGPQIKPQTDMFFYFMQPTLELQGTEVKEMMRPKNPDFEKNQVHLSNLVNSFFTGNLSTYYQESQSWLHILTNRWSPITENQYQKLNTLQNIFYLRHYRQSLH